MLKFVSVQDMDLLKLRPRELIRLVNSTQLGTVVPSESMVTRHMNAAGLRIGDGKTVNLVKYVAWLVGRHGDIAEEEDSYQASTAEAGQRHRDRMAALSRQRMSAASDITPIPDIVDRRRRDRCAKSLRKFCETYFPKVFYLKWSRDHLKIITRLERVVTRGGQLVNVMPRGAGKSSLTRAAAMWGVLYGYRKSIGIFAATEPKALKMLKGIRTIILKNRLLLEDFPEVLYPLVCLQNDARRQAKQHVNGELTLSTWGQEYIVLPTVTGANMPPKLREAGVEISPAAGSTIFTKSLDSQDIRGESVMTADGVELRPDCVLIDDPQTRQSARSPDQTKKRIDIIEGDILFMGGPDKRIAGLMTVTKIYDGDLAEHYIDRSKTPQWQGAVMKMVVSFPTNEKLWEEYRELLVHDLRSGDEDFRHATEFYRKHRAVMDVGAKVSWPERFSDNCVSAIQHAMNLKILKEEYFMAEMQGEPMMDDSQVDILPADEIVERLNNRPHLTVPTMCNRVVAFIDVHGKALYYDIVAVEDNFTPHLVDTGTYPKQRQSYFTLRQVKRTLKMSHRGAGEEGAIYAGLMALMEQLAGQAYKRDDGAMMQLDVCLVDTGYQKDVVERACKQSKFPGVFMPSKGVGVKATGAGLTDRKKQKGERFGENWRVTTAQGNHSLRLVLYDTNYWKTFLQARLATAIGDKGALTLWGDRPGRHRMHADHIVAEYPVRVEAKGRVVHEWQPAPGRPDNHLLDCLVGCMVAASMCGCELIEKLLRAKRGPPRKKKKAKYF